MLQTITLGGLEPFFAKARLIPSELDPRDCGLLLLEILSVLVTPEGAEPLPLNAQVKRPHPVCPKQILATEVLLSIFEAPETEGRMRESVLDDRIARFVERALAVCEVDVPQRRQCTIDGVETDAEVHIKRGDVKRGVA